MTRTNTLWVVEERKSRKGDDWAPVDVYAFNSRRKARIEASNSNWNWWAKNGYHKYESKYRVKKYVRSEQ